MLYFIGGLYPKNLYKYVVENSKGSIENAANALQWAMIQGLEECGCSVKIIALPSVRTYPLYFRKKTISSFNFSHVNGACDVSLSFCTFPIIGLISQYFSLKRELAKICLENEVVLIYSLKTPYLLAACGLKKRFPNIQICVAVPDLPQFMSESKNLIYRFLKKIDSVIISKCLRKVDSFILLSKLMTKPLHVANRSWVCVEGIYLPPKKIEVQKDTCFVFAYTGTLDVRYGVLDLINAFSKLEGSNYRLWICGKGNAEDKIRETASQDSRIIYWGQLVYEDALKIQRSATVLVNPRRPIGEYTLYSFPSKTMEYLGSGTPCIMYNLPAIPKEYLDYLFIVEDRENGLLDKMKEVSNFSREFLAEKGYRGRCFVEENKNPQKQMKKVINMFNLNVK